MDITFFEGSSYYMDYHLHGEHHDQDGIHPHSSDFLIDFDVVPTTNISPQITDKTEIAGKMFKCLVYSKQHLTKKMRIPSPNA